MITAYVLTLLVPFETWKMKKKELDRRINPIKLFQFMLNLMPKSTELTLKYQIFDEKALE